MGTLLLCGSGLLVLLSLSAIVPRGSCVYFNPMMPCPQFCQMLTKDRLRQVWCLIDVCKDSKLRRRLVTSYSKRNGGSSDEDVEERGAAFDWLPPIMTPHDYQFYMAGLMDKREKEFWRGPISKEDDSLAADSRLLKSSSSFSSSS